MGSSGLVFACVLFRSSLVEAASRDRYTPEWANKLYRGVMRNTSHDLTFKCVTDFDPSEFEAGIECVPLKLKERDYYTVMEALRPDVVGDRTVLVGLDTVVTGSLDDIFGFQGPVGLIRNLPPERLSFKWRQFHHRIVFANGIVSVDRRSAEAYWVTFMDRPAHWRETTVMPGQRSGSEMVFMYEQAPAPPVALDEEYPGQIVSFRYTAEADGDFRNARVVYFHGLLKPDTCRHRLIRKNWI